MPPTILSTDLDRLYAIVGALAQRNGLRTLAGCASGSGWPRRGVYFFFEPGEVRPGGAPHLTPAAPGHISA